MRIAQEVVTARIAQAEGKLGNATSAFEKAAALQEELPCMEAPYMYYPVRRSVGALRFLQGDLAGAEREFDASLRKSPNDPWALWGLAEVYRKQGQKGAAVNAERRLTRTRAESSGPIEMGRL